MYSLIINNVSDNKFCFAVTPIKWFRIKTIHHHKRALSISADLIFLSVSFKFDDNEKPDSNQQMFTFHASAPFPLLKTYDKAALLA